MNFLENNYLRNLFMGSRPRKTRRPKIDLSNKIRKIWVKKFDLQCFASFICLRACATNSWYFNNKWSGHMTGDKSILVNYKHVSDGLVTFDDRVKGRVLVKRTLTINFPRLKKVMHVEGVKANLISISEICDLNLNVHFIHEKCCV